MTKKILNLFVLLFSFTVVIAQQSVGQWKIFPTVGKQYDKIIDSKDKVYFLTASSLYSYDKDNHETYFYDSSNKLSGSDIRDIYYNHDGDYLMIVYGDNNLDMLYADGNCYSLPEIKDANMSDDKTVNDIAFGNERIVVATNFGIVVYDEKKREVIESGIYRTPVEKVEVIDGNIVLYTPYKLLHSSLSDNHNTIGRFKEFGGTFATDMLDVNEHIVAWVDGNNGCLVITTLDFENSKRQNVNTGIKVSGLLTPFKEGFYFLSDKQVLVYDSNAGQTDSFTIPDELVNDSFAFFEGKNSIWFGGEKGSANYDLSTSAPTVLSDWYRPESVTCKEISFLISSADGQRIYISNLGPSIIRSYLPGLPDNTSQRQFTNIIEDGKIRDVSIVNASATTSAAQNNQRINNNQAMYGGTTRLVEDPDDPETYYIGNGQEGLYVVKGNSEVWKFDVNNAPFKSYWNTRVFDVNFDPAGNLWVGMAHLDREYSPYIILPADKLRQDFDKIRNEDWVWARIPEYYAGTKDLLSFFSTVSNMAFFSCSDIGIYVVDTKGTYDNVADDDIYFFTTFADQDGNSFEPEYIFSMAEDHNGRVWIGSSRGIFYFNNPKAINDNANIVRPKVPRNDGTNYADFLLDSDQINGIAVDPSNRKWIATDFSGVYLVSENGDKILKHFDSSNSPLPSNRVTSVACDGNSNTVYFGTMTGLLSYKSDSSPAKDDYSEVYAYPNPVRPDYTGWITVAGLMDNSLVKIADAAGNVFFQGRSEGGMITWDGCNTAGERVRTGIYYVYASTGGEGQTSNAVVTKIMVIK